MARSKKRTAKITAASASGEFVLGRERFEIISAVEGIKRTATMKKRAAEFEKAGLSIEERRRKIIKVYRKT